MAQIVKKISAPYNLYAVNGQPTLFTVGPAITNNAEVVINGNLVVHGSYTAVDSTNASITDNIITLNKGGTPATTTLSGIEVDRGTTTFTPSIVWSEANQRWMLSNDGVTYNTISVQQFGYYISSLYEDPDPTLSADLDVNGMQIVSPTDIILVPTSGTTQLDSVLKLKETVAPSANVAGYGLLYAKEPDGGKSGIYVTNSLATDEELITKRQAIVYSLIF